MSDGYRNDEHNDFESFKSRKGGMTMGLASKKLTKEETYNDWKMDGKSYPVMSRKEEFAYCREKYPQIPKTFMLKQHCITRGVTLTDLAWKKFAEDDTLKHQHPVIFQRHKRDHTEALPVPDDFHFNDGTSIMVCLAPPENDPYVIDYIDEHYWLCGDDEVLEEVGFVERPNFYGQKTSTGIPMEHVALPGGDLLLFCPYHHCHFSNEGLQCRFCDLDYHARLMMKLGRGFKTRLSPVDCYDTLLVALEQEGRYTRHFITGGSDPRQNYEEEFDYHLAIVKAINKAGREMGIDRIPIWLIMSPIEKDKMKILYDAGCECFGVYFEVWGDEKFKVLCPGKAKWNSFDRFLSQAEDAVEVFGWGNVHGGFVSGAEMMYGYNDINEAVQYSLEGYEYLLERGIIPGGTQLTIEPGTILYQEGQTEPPLEFYCMLDLGRRDLFEEHKAYPKYFSYKDQYYTAYPDFSRLI